METVRATALTETTSTGDVSCPVTCGQRIQSDVEIRQSDSGSAVQPAGTSSLSSMSVPLWSVRVPNSRTMTAHRESERIDSRTRSVSVASTRHDADRWPFFDLVIYEVAKVPCQTSRRRLLGANNSRNANSTYSYRPICNDINFIAEYSVAQKWTFT
jgi:hypothetical protein